jgi:hypothetical protein
MGPDNHTDKDDLHKRWTERLGKWLRRPEAEEKPTTAASQTMREDLDEPRE